MHELSLAINIVETVQEVAIQEKLTSIFEIEMEVGDLSGVIVEALEFAMEEAVKNTIIEKAKRTIIKVSAIAKCNECNTEYNLDDVFTPCPNCASFNNEIIAGREFKLYKIKGSKK